MSNLIAGQVHVKYENGSLRSFKVGDSEVLRRIYFAVRDENWATYSPQIYDETIIQNRDSFEINFRSDYERDKEVFLTWEVQIFGFDTGKIVFEIIGNVKQDFQTNRAGFCVLHPIQGLTGHSVEIVHSNSSTKTLAFPQLIDPYQPFFDVVGMNWGQNESRFSLQFEGDIFETEDQRNWGDASYKTYCTPLSVPFPRTLKKGETIHQKIIFSVLEIAEKLESIEKKDPPKTNFNIGIFATKEQVKMDLTVMEKLKALNLGHYSAEIDLSENEESDFESQITLAENLNLPIDLKLIFSENIEEELGKVEIFLSSEILKIEYITLLSKNELVTSPDLISKINRIKEMAPDAKVGVGTNYNFTELNRFRMNVKEADFVSFSFHPQVHAFDDTTLLENTETVEYLVESAKALYHLPVHISAITLKARSNPYASESSARTISIENQRDSRQKTDFLATWTDSLFEYLAIAGVSAISCFQTVGDLGIMDEKGNEFPIYESLRKYLTNH